MSINKGERNREQKINYLYNFLAILVVLPGCASNPPISSLTSLERERVSNIVFIESREIPKDSYKVLGSVEGLACKRNLHAPGAPAVEEARQGVKIRAAQLGANAVINWHEIIEFRKHEKGVGQWAGCRYYLSANKYGSKPIEIADNNIEGLDELIYAVFDMAKNASFVKIENISSIPFLKKVRKSQWDRM